MSLMNLNFILSSDKKINLLVKDRIVTNVWKMKQKQFEIERRTVEEKNNLFKFRCFTLPHNFTIQISDSVLKRSHKYPMKNYISNK